MNKYRPCIKICITNGVRLEKYILKLRKIHYAICCSQISLTICTPCLQGGLLHQPPSTTAPGLSSDSPGSSSHPIPHHSDDDPPNTYSTKT